MQSWLSVPIIEWILEPDELEVAWVTQAIAPPRSGRVYWRGTYWYAQVKSCDRPYCICAGTDVIVLGRCGVTLLVTTDE